MGVAAYASVLVCSAAATGLRFVPGLAPFATTEQTFGALRTGDLASLRRLGVDAAVDVAVRREGLAELAERFAIAQRAQEAGSEEVQRWSNAIEEAGRAAFDALSRSEQARIRDASLQAFIMDEGLRTSGATLPPGSNLALFIPERPDLAVLMQLGRTTLSTADAGRLGNLTPRDDAAAADPALFELAVATAEAGERLYFETRRAIFTAGQSAFRALPYGRQQEIRNASFFEFVLRNGFDGAPADVRAAVREPAVLLDGNRRAALERERGMASLTLADRARLRGFDAQALADEQSAAASAFAAREGQIRVTANLRKFFSSGRCVDQGRVRRGEGTADLYLRGVAVDRVRCTHGDDDVTVAVEARWSPSAARWELATIGEFTTMAHFAESAESPPTNDEQEVSP